MEAVQWAAKVTAHIHTKHQGNTQLYKNVGGDVAEIHWISTFDDLGKFEAFRDALEQIRSTKIYFMRPPPKNILC